MKEDPRVSQQMDFNNTEQLLDRTNYDKWSYRMIMTLRTAGTEIWNSVVNGYIAPKHVKTMTQKDVKKNNSMATELILESLTDSMKLSIGSYSSAKELWDQLEQLCSEGKPKSNSDSAKESTVENCESNDQSYPNDSSKRDHCSQEGRVDVKNPTVQEEMSHLHKVIGTQTKRIFSLQSENDDVKSELEAAVREIGSLSNFIKQQEAELLKGAKNKEDELLQLLQVKEQELKQAKEEMNKAQKLARLSDCNSSSNDDNLDSNEAEKLKELEYAFINLIEEIKNDQTSEWDIAISKETFDNLEDIVICIINQSEIIYKRNILLHDSLQKIESKHGEIT